MISFSTVQSIQNENMIFFGPSILPIIMHRKAGVSRIQSSQKRQIQFQKAQENISTQSSAQLKELFTQLEQYLQSFVANHHEEMKQNPLLRQRFTQLCMEMGVDPLATKKSIWSSLGFGDFYNHVSVQVAQVCLSTRQFNGGLISLAELTKGVLKLRGNQDPITDQDIKTSIKQLQCLGDGFQIMEWNGTTFVRSVPQELSLDDTTVLQITQPNITIEKVINQLEWTEHRAQLVFDRLVQQGIFWIDHVDKSYWIAGQYA
jgi:ESCRT-II complex subunit VPS22